MNSNVDEVFGRLARSSFRRRFRLRAGEKDYLERRGLDTVMSHGEKFIEERLAPADPPNDGKQTPMRNHPIFVAQHATATCCRGCLEKWHGIPKGHALTTEEKAYILSVLRRWLVAQGDACRRMRALSVRQPWAELILLGHKVIEVRSRRTNLRERVYIYAGLNRIEPQEEARIADQFGIDVDGLPRGVLVGTVQIVDPGPRQWARIRAS
jgi:hypothetical protein